MWRLLFCRGSAPRSITCSGNPGIDCQSGLPNLSMQGRTCDIFQAVDKIAAFKKKLSVWKDRVGKGVYDMFPLFSSLADESEADLGSMCKLMGTPEPDFANFEEYFPSRSDPGPGNNGCVICSPLQRPIAHNHQLIRINLWSCRLMGGCVLVLIRCNF